jgi:hypothetical protein
VQLAELLVSSHWFICADLSSCGATYGMTGSAYVVNLLYPCKCVAAAAADDVLIKSMLVGTRRLACCTFCHYSNLGCEGSFMPFGLSLDCSTVDVVQVVRLRGALIAQ